MVGALATAILMTLVPAAPAAARTEAPPTEPREIFSIGDSIFSEWPSPAFDTWPTAWPAALEDTDYVFSGNDGVPARSIATVGALEGGLDAVTTNRAAIASSDAFITNLGTNDAQLGAAWESLARQYLAAIRAVNPDIVIHWITPVAEPGVAASFWIDRSTDHAATLRTLHAEGEIDVLIEWDEIALKYRSNFDDDGIHYARSGHTSNYVNFAASQLDPVPPPTTPSPRCGRSDLPWSAWDRPLDDSIRRIYLGLARREPTDSELATLRTELASHGQKALIAEPLLALADVDANTEPDTAANRLSWRIFRRRGDASFITTWGGAIRNGTSVADVAVQLVESAEFVNSTDTAEPQSGRQGAVCRIYLAGHGRIVERGGLDYWTVTGEMAWVANAIAESDEFTTRFPNRTDYRTLINTVYERVLDRTPDAGGYNYWYQRLSNGLTPGHFVLEVSNSSEFAEKTNTLPYR